MNKNIFLLLIVLAVLISCNKKESSEFYIIKGEIENFEGDIFLSPGIDTLYYSNNFREDTATVVDGKFKFKLSTKIETPLPFAIRSSNSIFTMFFLLEPQNQEIIFDSIDFGKYPTIVGEYQLLYDEQDLLIERMRSSKEKLASSMNEIYSSNYSNDSILKLVDIAKNKFKKSSLFSISEFSKDYPDSYVSFWYLALSQMIYGYDIEIENAYNNLSQKIKNSDVAKLFEQKLLMSKVSQTGSTFPAN